MYGGDANDSSEVNEALAAFGMEMVDAEEPQDLSTECWPDNWRVLTVFGAMGTQWQVGAEGSVIGMRYEALPFVFEMVGIKPKERNAVWSSLRVMEQESLAYFNKQK